MKRILRRRSLAGIGAAVVFVGLSASAEAYRFYTLRADGVVGSAAEAIRWNAEDFPLRFHLQDNVPDYLEETGWRDIVRESLAAWSAVGSASAQLSLEPGLVEGDGADLSDERFSIGWVSFEEERSSFSGRALRAYRPSTGKWASCDVEMNVDRFREWLDEGVALESVVLSVRETLVHEVGHCLGLDHTEPLPIPGWWATREGHPPIPAGFLPETIMSYAFGQGAVPSEDEKTAVSLLYPAPRFLASRGSVSGRLVRDSENVPFAYLQAVYPGVRPRMGPGVFADEEGYFHLEGLEDGPLLLWIHPILIHHSNAHGEILAMAFEGGGLNVLDQWQWVRVTRGENVAIPDIELAEGRLR